MNLIKSITFLGLLALLMRSGVGQQVLQESKVNVELINTIPASSKIGTFRVDILEYVGDQEIYFLGEKIVFFAASGRCIRYFDENDMPVLEKQYDKEARIEVSNNGRYILIGNKAAEKLRLENMEGVTLWEKVYPERLKIKYG